MIKNIDDLMEVIEARVMDYIDCCIDEKFTKDCLINEMFEEFVDWLKGRGIFNDNEKSYVDRVENDVYKFLKQQGIL